MIRTAIVNTTTNLVENVVDYEAVPAGTPPGMAENYIAVASDVAEIGMHWDGVSIVVPEPPPPSQAQQNAIVAAAVQAWLDAGAQAPPYGYNDIETACGYGATSTNDLWKRQGVAFAAWRDAVWAKVFDIQAQVQAGTMQQPATIDAFIALLPPSNIPTA